MKILVVHRQVEIAQKIKTHVNAQNCFINYCDTGLDGLFAGRHESFDFIFCEINLPVISGIEMIRSLRMSSSNINTPVIFIAEDANDKLIHLAETLDVKYVIDISQFDQKLDELLLHVVLDERKAIN